MSQDLPKLGWRGNFPVVTFIITDSMQIDFEVIRCPVNQELLVINQSAGFQIISSILVYVGNNCLSISMGAFGGQSLYHW